MSLTFRRAHEKRNSLTSGRRGRREDVPLEIYYELDDLAKQIAGLRNVVGASREAVAAIAGGGAVPTTPGGTGEGAPPIVIENVTTIGLVANAGFLQASRTNPRFLQWESVLLRARMNVEVDGGGVTTSRGIVFLTARGSGAQAVSLVAAASAINITVTNNVPFDFGNFLDPAAFVKSWSPGTEFILGFTRAGGQPNVNVSGELTFREKIVIQQGGR